MACESESLRQLRRPSESVQKAGSISSAQPQLSLPRKTGSIRLNQRSPLKEGRVGRAAKSGPQTIRLIFDEPQNIKRIQLIFEENERSRTQEFVLRWSSDGGITFEEIVRQQWNFSPPETRREAEEYRIDLLHATTVELGIVPDISGGSSRASLKSMRLS